jgi:hypothetical protein
MRVLSDAELRAYIGLLHRIQDSFADGSDDGG